MGRASRGCGIGGTLFRVSSTPKANVILSSKSHFECVRVVVDLNVFRTQSRLNRSQCRGVKKRARDVLAAVQVSIYLPEGLSHSSFEE